MQKRQILLVDDKERRAARLKARLEGLGHRVVGLARDGQEAVGSAWRLDPELIIMESRLPLIDGIETARTIVAHKLVPIILLTAYAADDLVRRAHEAGVMAHLPTPVETWQLEPTIEVAVARFGQLEAIRREVSDLKEALTVRTTVDQAKRILMRRLKLSEAEAFARLQSESQRMGTRLGESAANIVKVEEILFRKSTIVRDLPSALGAIRRGLLRSNARRPLQAAQSGTSPP